MADKHVTGPIQVFVIGFDKFEATGRIMAELRRARKRGVIRLIDVIFVQKNRHGDIEQLDAPDRPVRERAERLGAIAGGLIGLHAGGGAEGMVEGAELGALAVAERDAGLSVDRMQELADSIPAGSAAAILVIEHHWAASLRDAIVDAGGRTLMQAMIAPDALAIVGDELRVKMEAEDAIEAAEEIKLAAAMRDRPDARRGRAHRGGRHRRSRRCRRHGARRRGCRRRGRRRHAVRGRAHRGGRQGRGRERRVACPSTSRRGRRRRPRRLSPRPTRSRPMPLCAPVRALIAADLIEQEAAQEAVDALVTAQMIEQEAADEALASVLAAEAVGAGVG